MSSRDPISISLQGCVISIGCHAQHLYGGSGDQTQTLMILWKAKCWDDWTISAPLTKHGACFMFCCPPISRTNHISSWSGCPDWVIEPSGWSRGLWFSVFLFVSSRRLFSPKILLHCCLKMHKQSHVLLLLAFLTPQSSTVRILPHCKRNKNKKENGGNANKGSVWSK